MNGPVKVSSEEKALVEQTSREINTDEGQTYGRLDNKNLLLLRHDGAAEALGGALKSQSRFPQDSLILSKNLD